MVIKSKQDYIINQIEKAILSRQLKPGDKLLTERELQGKFNVGRGTIRESLKGLQQKGLIQIKKGAKGGAFVKEVDPEQVSQLLAMLIHHRQISLKHISEFRENLEGTIASHAAERASSQDIENLKKKLKKGVQIANSQKSNVEDFYKWEHGMHLELASISRNPLFEWLSGTIYLNLVKYSTLYSTLLNNTSSAMNYSLNDWKDIVEAISNGEATRASSIVKAHIIQFSRKMEDEND